jgi:hypothetical protein
MMDKKLFLGDTQKVSRWPKLFFFFVHVKLNIASQASKYLLESMKEK